MINIDECALICDIAQYYHIVDMWELNIVTLSVLAVGLPISSRIKQKMTNAQIPDSNIILAGIFDRANFLAWTKTKQAVHNKNAPNSIIKIKQNKNNSDILAFSSSNEFDKMREYFLNEERKQNGN